MGEMAKVEEDRGFNGADLESALMKVRGVGRGKWHLLSMTVCPLLKAVSLGLHREN